MDGRGIEVEDRAVKLLVRDEVNNVEAEAGACPCVALNAQFLSTSRVGGCAHMKYAVSLTITQTMKGEGEIECARRQLSKWGTNGRDTSRQCYLRDIC